MLVSQRCFQSWTREHVTTVHLRLSIISHVHGICPSGNAPFSFGVLWRISEVGSIHADHRERVSRSYPWYCPASLPRPFLSFLCLWSSPLSSFKSGRPHAGPGTAALRKPLSDGSALLTSAVQPRRPKCSRLVPTGNGARPRASLRVHPCPPTIRPPSECSFHNL